MDPLLGLNDMGLGGLLDPTGIGGPPGGIVPPPQPAAPPVGGMIPETIAQQFAQWGIGPQGVLGAQPQSPAGAATPAAPAGPPMSLGDSLVPTPTPRPMAAGPSATTDMSASSPTGPNMAQRLQGALRGVQMPAAPTPNRVGTPSVPGPRGQVKGGELLQLLQALGMGNSTIPSLGSALR